MTSAGEPIPVVIVGGGPAGVTAAILLASRGIRCLVLERFTEIYPQPRAVHLDDEVHRILGRLGVAEEFTAISRPALGLEVIDGDHRTLVRFDRCIEDGLHGYPQANLFDQPELERLLRARLAELPAATLRGGAEVTGLRQDPEGVTLDVRDGESGRIEQLRAAYVLGCDGANSLVRELIGTQMRDLRFEQRWLVVDVETDHDLGQWDGVHQLAARDRAGTYMRIGERRYRWEFQLRDGETAGDFTTIEALHPLIRPWTGAAPTEALHVRRSAEYTFRARVADRWRDRRVFLLGDAAHLTPPFVGQGMGAGLRDADNLAWKLAGVLHGTLPESVLDTYEAERKPHARTMIVTAIMIGFAMTGGGLAGHAFRRLALPRARFIPGLGKRAVSSETPRLAGSALVARTLDPRGLAGRLCPNALLADDRRFDDVADGGWVLVVRRPAPAPPHAPADVMVLPVDPTDPLGRWLRHGHAEAALVRPDGTVHVAGGVAAVGTAAARMAGAGVPERISRQRR